jgi:hypothetical protein
MNSDWVAQVCEDWAKNLLKDGKLDDAGRVELMYRKAYARGPTTKEAADALALVRSVEAALTREQPNPDQRRLQAWTSLCQTIVSANEFVYLN